MNYSAPVADQMNQTVGPSTIVRSQRECRVTRIAAQRFPEFQDEIVAVVESTIPVEDLGSVVPITGLIEPDSSFLCIRHFRAPYTVQSTRKRLLYAAEPFTIRPSISTHACEKNGEGR